MMTGSQVRKTPSTTRRHPIQPGTISWRVYYDPSPSDHHTFCEYLSSSCQFTRAIAHAANPNYDGEGKGSLDIPFSDDSQYGHRDSLIQNPQNAHAQCYFDNQMAVIIAIRHSRATFATHRAHDFLLLCSPSTVRSNIGVTITACFLYFKLIGGLEYRHGPQKLQDI